MKIMKYLLNLIFKFMILLCDLNTGEIQQYTDEELTEEFNKNNSA